MRVIIDKTVLNAEKYYNTYLRELSLVEDMTFTAKDIVATDELTLELILNELKAAKTGGEVIEPGIKLGSGFESNKGWEKQVEKWYDEWYERQGKTILKLANLRLCYPNIAFFEPCRQVKRQPLIGTELQGQVTLPNLQASNRLLDEIL